ncbi:hypothetical protein ACFTS5_11065 [Nocardia sp. NPDC056952]|uniref:hypothetical protein n=1 Tax=Nocardia sp. NPDC056952 TaxID=3345979 RepID=UPI003625AD63
MSLHAIQVRESIAPIDRLRDRERELQMLTEFCNGDGQSYLWIQGEPWAGKSALLSTFALDPAPNLTVVSFFITDRRAAQNDHNAFTAAILDQLAILLPDHKPRIQAEVLNRDGLRSELLAIAARQEAEKQRRLALVVDGLDEDTGKPPIVSLLPTLPNENLRILVASRHGPSLSIPHGHPLTTARRYLLTASKFAAGIRDRAVAELDALLEGPERERELLALITVANGLSVTELETLTSTAPFEIDRLLHGRAGRSFRASTISSEPGGGPDPVYALAHETLQRTAETRLGTRLLTASLDRLGAWAEQYREKGWPNSTPNLLLYRYFTVLERHHDLPRMAGLALDPARHELLYVRTGGDWAALTEIGDVQQCICDQPEPDLLTTARLARRRDHLHERNQHIPIALVSVRVRLGQTDRAEAIARSNFNVIHRVRGLALVVEAIASVDPDHAEAITRELTNPDQHAEVLALVAGAIASVDPDRAEAITRELPTRMSTLRSSLWWQGRSRRSIRTARRRWPAS